MLPASTFAAITINLAALNLQPNTAAGTYEVLDNKWPRMKEELIDAVRQGVDRAITGVFWALSDRRI